FRSPVGHSLTGELLFSMAQLSGRITRSTSTHQIIQKHWQEWLENLKVLLSVLSFDILNERFK
ncbi:hypothetical protein, partial [Candidatus Thiodiazotropha endoloripes]|uniref:hypothetical protein n=1 Tax=Candidatus Thiodiazotropha endoloripes TaxID=1818881 RepID=UPI001F41EA4B